MAWHIPLLNRTQLSLKSNLTHTRFKILLYYCIENPENTWTSRQPGAEHAVACEISRVPAVAAHSVIDCSTMPCAAGSLCALKPDHTLGPPHFTNHKCRACGGWSFLHGLCGVRDPLSDNMMHRVCHPCVTSTTRKESGDEANSSAGDKNQSTQPVRLPRPPPNSDVAEYFGGLEEVAERCRMTEVSYHIRKAKLAWMGEVGSRKTKQTCIAEFV